MLPTRLSDVAATGAKAEVDTIGVLPTMCYFIVAHGAKKVGDSCLIVLSCTDVISPWGLWLWLHTIV